MIARTRHLGILEPTFLCGCLVVFLLCGFAVVGQAQQEDSNEDPETSSTEAHDADIEEEIEEEIEEGDEQAAAYADTATTGPYFKKFIHKPKAGLKSDVRLQNYNAQLHSDATMRQGSSFNSKLDWSWDEYRKQDKTIEKRKADFKYTAGLQLPINTDIKAQWDWSEDKTVNTAGRFNLNKRNNKTASVALEKKRVVTGAFSHTFKAGAGYQDQQAVNQSQNNDVSEGNLRGGFQTGTQLTTGVSIAGRLAGSTTSGDRTLGNSKSPSSAQVDSVGFGVYFAKKYANGRLAVTRSNFNKKYLDFRRNANGLVDTVPGMPESEKIVQELETNDAISIDFSNKFDVGRFGFDAKLAKTMNDQAYARNGAGLRERESNTMDLGLTYSAGRDSFALQYKYAWKWDDQTLKNASESLGRQIKKNRDFSLSWFHLLFSSTDLTVKFHQGLAQDIVKKNRTKNDKDRLLTDFSVKLERGWDNFNTSMIYAFASTEDIAIDKSKSANNNVKDSHEIAPGYAWDISRWLTISQSYRVYIQYTDYDFAHLETVNKSDNYNKRGNLNTVITLRPSKALDVRIKYDYNKRFNATKAVTDASGSTYYNKDQIVTTSKIDLGIVYRATKGVTLEAATYNNLDRKSAPNGNTPDSSTQGGRIWVGAKVAQTFGEDNPLQLSAMVKKFNAYGPGVTATSADYWETDIWLKWSF